MSIREVILSEMRKIGVEQDIQLPALTDNLSLIDSGLDSLAFAILVTRLEDELGFDPFTEADETRYPTTVGDLIEFYENVVARV
jgi:acyl carrier protein